jgi:hypothetical protein
MIPRPRPGSAWPGRRPARTPRPDPPPENGRGRPRGCAARPGWPGPGDAVLRHSCGASPPPAYASARQPDVKLCPLSIKIPQKVRDPACAPRRRRGGAPPAWLARVSMMSFTVLNRLRRERRRSASRPRPGGAAGGPCPPASTASRSARLHSPGTARRSPKRSPRTSKPASITALMRWSSLHPGGFPPSRLLAEPRAPHNRRAPLWRGRLGCDDALHHGRRGTPEYLRRPGLLCRLLDARAIRDRVGAGDGARRSPRPPARRRWSPGAGPGLRGRPALPPSGHGGRHRGGGCRRLGAHAGPGARRLGASSRFRRRGST